MFGQYFITQIIVTGVVLAINPLLKIAVKKLIFRFGKATLKNENRVTHMARIVGMMINIISILAIAMIWGVTRDSFFGALSAIFAVIGVAMFAQWSLLSNITAGIIIFFSMPFRIGDEINIKDKDMPIVGVIENIFTFHMHVRTSEGELVVIPNNLFLQKMVAIEHSDLNL